MDFDGNIGLLESTIARLQSQREQERAMAEILPTRFELNMAAFRRYLPAIGEQFSDYIPGRAFTFFCTENGIPNLRWADSDVAFYEQDPYAYCQRQIESVLGSKASIQTLHFSKEANPLEFIHVDFMNRMVDEQQAAAGELAPISEVGSDIPLMLMYGVGLGYQLSYLYERCQPNVLFIIEPDFDLFYASLFTFDWHALLGYIDEANLALHVFLGQDKDEIVQDIAIAAAKVGAYLSAANVGFWHYRSAAISELITKTKQEFFFLVSGWGFFDDNLIALSHCMENVRRDLPFLIEGKTLDKRWENVPLFVVGNGPSLDGAIETLKRYRHEVVILSCGSALSALHRAGIRPDIHVQVERTKVVPDSHRLLQDEAYLKGILFLSVDVIHPDCADQFDRVGLAFKSFEPGVSLLRMHAPVAHQRDILASANPMVGNTGLATACRLGFKDIYLFGIDNGYKNDSYHHSKFSFYFDAEGKPKARLDAQISKKNKHITPGNFGGTVTTTSMMINTRVVMENLLGQYPETRVHNCSDGARIKGAAPLAITDIVIDNPGLDKSTLLDHIFEDLYRPMGIDVGQFGERLDTNLLYDFIDKFAEIWSKKFTSRQEVIAAMMRVREYLQGIRLGGYEHIYRSLVGSINYSFSVILSTLYRFAPSDELYIRLDDMIGVMVDYFMAMKAKYLDALNSVDRKEHGLFDH